MGVETYTVQYIADPSAFVAGARQVEAAVRSVDAMVTASKKNLSGFAGGGGRSAANAAKKINDLAVALNGVAPAANSAKSSLTGLGGAAAGATKATSGLTSSTIAAVAQATAVAVAWKAATAALNMYTKASEDAKKHMNEGAESGSSKRQKAAEYAGLLGKNAVDDETMKRVFRNGQAGGMKFDEALKFGEQFMGSITAGRDKGHITPEQEAVMENEAAMFKARMGLDAATAGDLVAVIPQSVDMTKGTDKDPNQKLSTEEGVDKAMGQLGAMTAALQDGRGKISTLARSELAAASSALPLGHVKDHAEQGAFAGTASTFSKSASGSGTAFKQFDRLINENLDEGGEFLKSIGVAGEKGDFDKLVKLKQHVDAQRAAAPDPSKFDAKGYLQTKGFHNDTELDATVAYLENFDALKVRRERGQAAAKDGKSVRAANRQFMASQAGQAAQAGAIQEAGEYEQTRGRQRVSDARKAAHGQLMAEGKIHTFWDNLTGEFKDATINRVMPETEDESRINAQVLANARKAIRTAGLTDQVVAADPRFMDLTAQEVRAKGYKNVPTYGDLVPEGYGGQDVGKIDELLNRFGPQLETKNVPINGRTIDVGVNPFEAAARQGVQAQVQGGALGQAGVGAPAGAGNAAAGGMNVGGPRASVDASGLDKVTDKFDKSLDKLNTFVANLRQVPSFGGSYGPYRT